MVKKMPTLIDADKLKTDFIGNRYGTQAIEYVIDQQPPVDAVEVVRCKDCQYFGRLDHEIYCYMLGANKTIKFSEDG